MSDVATVGLASKLAGMITRLGDDLERRCWLSAARQSGCPNIWSKNFATDILHKRDLAWLSPKQIDSLNRILRTAHQHSVRPGRRAA
jgi:hypothetical protein